MNSPNLHNKRIKLLPEHLIDQIKAGEVIERPASLLKELIENSIDAKSSRIDVQIIENGMDLISVQDNGVGIMYEDLPYAFCRHATSKIERFEDIYRLQNYGFRGEALASISSVSRLTCSSIPINQKENGGKITIHGGRQVNLIPAQGSRNGTSIHIKDLFYNTPARLKFIKSKTSERNALKRIINSFIISNPQISFSIQWDSKEKELYNSPELKKRIQKIFFKAFKNPNDLVEVNGEYEGHKILGLFSTTSSKGNSGKIHYLFCNNRLFMDNQLHRIILSSLENYWPLGETGHYCFFIEAPPNEIDVNVHPNKTSIKFFKSSLVLSLASSSIKDAINVINASKKNNFKDDKAPAIPDHFSNSLDQEDCAVKQDGNFQILTNQYFITTTIRGSQNNSRPYLVNANNLIGHFWLENIQNGPTLAEDQITPLLISEPFDFEESTVDKFFPALKQIGFEFDRLDKNTIVLRTIPNYLDNFPLIGDSIRQLLVFLENNTAMDEELTEKNYATFLENFLNINITNLGANYLDNLLNQIEFNDLINTKTISEITNKKLDRLF